jgi:hypothetical protein
MALSWNEIRSRATVFAKDYKSASGEIQDYADFWTDFFNIFGVRRRSVASYQKAVQKINGHTGWIDLFWPGVLLVEHKSKGEDLESASVPVNKKAVKLVVDLYRALYDGMYQKEYLAQLMVRLVFLFFADDTGIFEPNIFYEYLLYIPKENGEDLGAHLGQIFQILNTPEDKRQQEISEDLNAFPYVNGPLFKDPLPLPFFNKEMYREIIRAAEFDWGAVSPAIFGSMFQSVMEAGDKDMRHDFGAHYTSEKNILKVIDGLFLDEIKEELKAAAQNSVKLNALWAKIAAIKLFDPACGCGNFLVVAYGISYCLFLGMALVPLKPYQKGEYYVRHE